MHVLGCGGNLILENPAQRKHANSSNCQQSDQDLDLRIRRVSTLKTNHKYYILPGPFTPCCVFETFPNMARVSSTTHILLSSCGLVLVHQPPHCVPGYTKISRNMPSYQQSLPFGTHRPRDRPRWLSAVMQHTPASRRR